LYNANVEMLYSLNNGKQIYFIFQLANSFLKIFVFSVLKDYLFSKIVLKIAQLS